MVTGLGEPKRKSSGFVDIQEHGVIEYLEHPFGKGDLTSDGIQWTDPATAANAGTYATVAVATIEPDVSGKIFELELGLTGGFSVVSDSTADLSYQWQGRNKGGSWVNVAASVLKADINTTVVEETRSGRRGPVANLDRVPFEIQLLVTADVDAEGVAKIKNSSYAKVLYSSLQ